MLRTTFSGADYILSGFAEKKRNYAMDFKYTSRPLLAGVLVALVLGATGCATMVQPLLANFGPAEGKTLRLEVYMFGKTDATVLESSSDAH